MTARRYAHAGKVVSAMRFVGNGPDVARFAEPFGRADGYGLGGTLRVGEQKVECGDWVVRDGAGAVSIVAQEIFACGYGELRHANKQ